MTQEYMVTDNPIKQNGRFAIYAGDMKGHYDIAARCKPDMQENDRWGLVAQITADENDVHMITLVGSEARFYARGYRALANFALELVEVIHGRGIQMVMDLTAGAIRIPSSVYAAADQYGVVDTLGDLEEPQQAPVPETATAARPSGKKPGRRRAPSAEDLAEELPD